VEFTRKNKTYLRMSMILYYFVVFHFLITLHVNVYTELYQLKWDILLNSNY